jgi:hypothetical protein
MHVFIVLVSKLAGPSVQVEVRGVFAHMHQATPFVQYLRKQEGLDAQISKHEVLNHVFGTDPVARSIRMRIGLPEPAFPEAGQ